MPVRAKQRPSSGDRVAVEKEWRRLLRDVVGLLLPWRNPVSVYIKETNVGLELRFRPPHTHKSGATSGPHDLVSRVSRTLTQANLADAADAESWELVGASAGGMSVTGCVSLNPVASRRSQFICLGIQPIPNDAGSDALYDEVNRVFANSSFALHDEDVKAQGSRGGIFGQRLKRGVDRWPMFYFRIDVADRVEGGRYRLDQFLDQGHRVEAVTDLLKAVCYEFFRKHHFGHRSAHHSIERRQSPSNRDSSPSSRLSTAPTRSKKSSTGGRSPFDMWSRVKAGKPLNAPKPGSPMSAVRSPSSPGLKDRTDQECERPGARPPLLGRDGKLLRPPFSDAIDPTEANVPKKVVLTKGTSEVTQRSSASPKPSTKQKEPGVTRPDATPNPPQKDSKPSEWIADILKTWENPVFPPVQPSVPRTYDDALLGCPTHNTLPETPSIPLQSRISRAALRDAEVISQVDKKFILIKVPTPQDPSPTLLVLIDQHAADERRRLEDLTSSYFLPNGAAVSEPLPEPIRFEVPPREGALLIRLRGHFSRWGIAYSASKTEVAVFALPPSILERSRQEPRLLIELLRTEIWRVDERGMGDGDVRVFEDREDWVRLFHGCPSGILDLLNSRACRSKCHFHRWQTCPSSPALLAQPLTLRYSSSFLLPPVYSPPNVRNRQPPPPPPPLPRLPRLTN